MSAAIRRLLGVAALAGAVLVLGFAFEPRRAWGAWLAAFVTVTELSLAGLLFLALAEAAAARWADPLRPVARAMGAALPAAAALGAGLLLGTGSLYEWAHAGAGDELLERKSAWLNLPFFALRLVACFAAWMVLARALRARLGAPPAEREDPSRRGRDLRLAAIFVAVFAITWSIASVDWISSLEPHWFSTIFALRTATGLVVSGLAAATILVVLLRERAPLAGRVDDAALGDLGKLLLSFSILWVYVAYCQHMLIWYTDLPEEAVWYARRAGGGWRALTWASLALAFVGPFLVLLLRRARRSPAVLLRVSFALLIGQALDLFVMIGPAVSGEVPAVGPWEIAAFTGAFALFFALALRSLAGAAAAASRHCGAIAAASSSAPARPGSAPSRGATRSLEARAESARLGA